MSDAKLSLKVIINKQNTKVLFAEADSDFTDVLLSFLTLPLGKIARVLDKQYGDEAPVFGSLTTLYKGLANLDSAHFWTEGGKQMLLDPRSSFHDTQPIKYFSCENMTCKTSRLTMSIGMYYGTAICRNCGEQLKREIPVRDSASQAADGDGGVFTISLATFVISDDLQILPNVTASVVQILSYLGISDVEGAVVRNVSFGINEIKDLLKWSLLSRTPLTNLILNKENISSAFATAMGMSSPRIEKVWDSNSRAMTLKVIVRKSTREFLFAEADEVFADFLFSLLTVPLGGVGWLLGCSTDLKNIDNLYRSVANMNGNKYMKQNAKAMLLKPKLPYGYASENRILPLFEQEAPFLYYYKGNILFNEYLGRPYTRRKGNYVKGPRMFMITDDLTVTPLCTASGISMFSDLKIPLSDIHEMQLQIEFEEVI
ncbi:hypothetical protein PHJA_000098400 [Phtheirospermum japonicum]|uniref:Uncharacterized protein n=1 Tax=Phtheirospermum japonicum TaxID=374723 RepID=A0A830B2G4_9LAMI|nr:hypothetical protein PHJA_000098400 [Phtheirospermum japonicum]